MGGTEHRRGRIDIDRVNAAALIAADLFARNPHRTDRRLGGPCISLVRGPWAPFALRPDAKGRDLISPVAPVGRTHE